MRLPLDVGVGRNVEEHFASAGLDVLTIRQMNPSMPDEEIHALAQSENRIVITMDKDFGDLIYHSTLPQHNPGVILWRKRLLPLKKLQPSKEFYP